MFEAIVHILFVGGLITATQILGGYIIASIIINKQLKKEKNNENKSNR
jgi:hypothetical protein